MPSKRSRSKERERKRKQRERLSAELKSKYKERAREGMKKCRDNLTNDEKEKNRLKSKEGMKRLREKDPLGKKETLISKYWPEGVRFGDTPLYKREREMQKLYMRKRRENLTKEEKSIEKEERNDRMKKLRENKTLEERKIENEKAKLRMKTLRQNRKNSVHGLESSSESSLSASPDIVSKLNAEYRNANEKEINSEIECVCDIDINCEYCLKIQESESVWYEAISVEDRDKFQKEDLEQYKNLLKNERKSKRKELKERAKKPLPPLPARELSEYEKIRENIITQRNKEWLVYEKEWEKQWEEKNNRK